MAAFLVTLVTGVLLMFYYKPHPLAAYDSIKDIHFVVPTGRFIRNIHRWAANAMVVVVLLHMARVFFTAAYRNRREFNWLVGMALLATTLGLSFTGYLLPWDQLAYWAITIGANIAQSPREVTDALNITDRFDPGGFQKLLLLGSDTVGEEALIRFYVLHVMLLPLVLAALAGRPLLADQEGRRPRAARRRGRARRGAGRGLAARLHGRPAQDVPARGARARKDARRRARARGDRPLDAAPLLRELAVLMLTVAGCLALGILSDAPLKELANPSVPENPAKAPWYFLGLQELVSYSAFMGGIGIPAIVLLGLGLIPFLDRETRGTGEWFGGPGGKKLVLQATGVGLLSTLAIETLAIRFGWIREWFPHVPQLVVTFLNPGTVLTAIFAAYSMWLVRRHDSTRAGALGLFTCFLCGFVVLTVIGSYFRGPNWAFYWSHAAWPAH